MILTLHFNNNKMKAAKKGDPKKPTETKKEEKKIPADDNPEPVEEKKEEPKPEVKKEPIENYLKLTNDFKDMVRAHLNELKQGKEQKEFAKTQAMKEMKKKRKEEAQAKQQKFTTFKKKPPFQKAVQTKGFFQAEKTTVMKHDLYHDGKQMYTLTALDRVKIENKWKPAKHRMDSFKDVPLEKLDKKTKKKVMEGEEKYQTLLKEERERYKGMNDGTLKKTLMDTKLQSTKVWKPNSFKKDFFEDEKPLNDATYTPRHRNKAISLERNYEKKVWQPSKVSMDYFGDKKKVFKQSNQYSLALPQSHVMCIVTCDNNCYNNIKQNLSKYGAEQEAVLAAPVQAKFQTRIRTC
eukprot:TRINITY_DN2014_c0_g1_i1.p4 TRINITY_DN2014_c0_g1~~TRINITY_DN2014_c0_g1_i1.p4  ORF type:complete len:350 (+),score=69.13 TRINITY_DN2014_c0_g1_i1:48-1097(+)